MKKDITLFFTDALKEDLVQMVHDQSYPTGSLESLENTEVMGSRQDGWDFSAIVSKLTDKYNINKKELFILDQSVEELQDIIEDNKINNAISSVMNNIQMVDPTKTIFGLSRIKLMPNMDISDFEYNEEKERYESIVTIDTDKIQRYKEEIIDSLYERGEVDSEELEDIIKDEYEIDMSDLRDDAQRHYPVDCEEIYNEYVKVLDQLNVYLKLSEYYENKFNDYTLLVSDSRKRMREYFVKGSTQS